MKRHGVLVLALLALGGCTLTAEPMAPFVQPHDLTDPDSDGVINARELCAGTPLGSQVDNDGCPTQVEQEKRADLIVLFANDKADVLPDYLPQIEKMAAFMQEFKEVSLEIEGHTSLRGTLEHNQKLSEDRAKEVKRIMVEDFGVDPARLTIMPYGPTRLAMPEKDEASEAANRRAVGSLVGATSDILQKWTVYTLERQGK